MSNARRKPSTNKIKSRNVLSLRTTAPASDFRSADFSVESVSKKKAIR